MDDRWLVIHGGFDGATCINDVFALDTTTNIWTQILVPAAAASQPGPRALHSLCAIHGQGAVVYGGASSSTVHSDAYLLHNAAMSEGTRTHLELVGLQQKQAEQECALLRAVATADVAEGEAARAAIAKQVRFAHSPPTCASTTAMLSGKNDRCRWHG